ncbi:MAG: glycosyltransferase [Planctomycetes bacterium]|nr:glycosyltransferase [Planctomycetota bacterium]
MMTLAIVIDRFDAQRGGAERYLAELATRLVQLGHRVRVYCVSHADVPTGVVVIPIAAGGTTRVARERRFATMAATRARADGCAPLLAIRHVPEATVYQPHGGAWAASAAARVDSDPSPLRKALRQLFHRASPRHRHFRAVEREILARADVTVLAVSDRVRADLLAIDPGADARIVVLAPAIDVARFQAVAAARAAARRSPRQPARLLFCGHDFVLKGLSHALSAFARCDARIQGAVLEVIGRGDPGPFKREAARLGITDRVAFRGASADLSDSLRAADLLLHPTWFDPCALVCLEALAAAVPVVTTERNGAASLVRAARGRVVRDPTAHAELAAAIDALLADADAPAHAAAVGATLGWEAHLKRLLPLLVAAAARSDRR